MLKQISPVQLDKERSKLSETAQDLFSFLNQFAELLKVESTLRLYLVEDPVQNIECDYCSVFQLYFYNVIFGSDNNSKILDHENLSKTTAQTLLNELFSLDQDNNKSILRESTKQNNIKFD